MAKLNLISIRAMHIREAYQQVYQAESSEEFEGLLNNWYYWATHSQLVPIVKVAKTIKKHWEGILSWKKSQINNGILEGLNSVLQAAKRKARGYKVQHFKTITYLLTDKLDFSKINSNCLPNLIFKRAFFTFSHLINMPKLAIIGGTGLTLLKGLESQTSHSISTPFGTPSAEYVCGNLNGLDIVFLARHGSQHTVPPHKINYRANIWGLKELGVTDIIAVAAVGGISSAMSPSLLAIPDQIIDYSYGREHTFFAEDFESHNHIDFTFPYNKQLREQLIQSAKKINLTLNHTGTYGCTQGPRLESSAEIIRMERDGCDLVGMTGMPETALAKELGLNYATIAVIVNWAAGKSTGEILFSEIEQNIKIGMADVDKLIASFILGSLQ